MYYFFLQKSQSSGGYLELQASPLQQLFALNIITPRKETKSVKQLQSKIISKITETGFEVSFKIPLLEIPGEGKTIIGNYFACLGQENDRSYFSSNPNSEQKPDFHRPDLFIELGQI